jgi:hypothetical protein
MTVTFAAMHEQNRREMALMLGYDYANLTAAQSVRLDRAATLRLQLDDIQSAQLRGEQIDMSRFTIASKELEVMLGGTPDGQAPVNEFSGSREELAALILRRVEAIRAREAQLDAAADPDGSDVEHGAVSSPAPELRAAVGASEPEPPPTYGAGVAPWGAPPTEPAAASPPPPRKTLEEINAQKPPAHYLKGPDEPWRPFVNEEGIIPRSR